MADNRNNESPDDIRPAGVDRTFLWKTIRSHKAVLATAIGLSLAGTGLAIMQPRIMQTAVNQVTAGESATKPLLFLVLAVVGSAAVASVQYYASQRAAKSISRSLRDRLARRYLSMSVRAHDQSTSGDLQMRCMADAGLVESLIGVGVIPAFGAVVLLIGIAASMAAVDPVLFAITIGAVAAGAVVVYTCGPTVRRISQSVQEATSDVACAIDRMLGGIRTIKAFGAEAAEYKRVQLATGGLWRTSLKLVRLQAGVQPILNLCFQGAIVAVIAVGSVRVASGQLDLGGMLAYLMYLFLLAVPISSVGQSYTHIQVGLAAVARLREIDDLPRESQGSLTMTSAAPLRTSNVSDQPLIEVENVSFCYDEATPVLRDVSMAVSDGEHVAIVGGSGCGKTTLLEILMRFYEPTTGLVRVAGSPATGWPLAHYRREFGLLGQGAPVLTGTIRDNLSMGTVQVADEVMTSVLRRVGLGDLIESSRSGLDTDLGEEGTGLSGGQRQRLAWARVLVADPPCLLLDEPTSHLDAIADRDFYDVIDEFAGEKTVITVTHRLAAARRADRIVVMCDGEIIGSGTHHTLLEEVPYYRRLVESESHDHPAASRVATPV
ncbi:ABC transporter ATP-binding protein [Prescottella equi]